MATDVDSNEGAQDQEQQLRVAALREMIREAFSAETYEGMITPVDREWTSELDDEEETLYFALKGRKWTEVPVEFVDSHPRDIVFLTSDAFAALIPAWLVRSLENMGGENEVRQYLIYTCNPRQHSVLFAARRFRKMKSQQRSVPRLLLVEFAEREPSEFLRDHGAQAVGFIDSLDGAPLG